MFIVTWEMLYIVGYSFLQFPKDLIYNYLEIKFIKGVSKDMYHKINNLPSVAFEEIGVGEYINNSIPIKYDMLNDTTKKTTTTNDLHIILISLLINSITLSVSLDNLLIY